MTSQGTAHGRFQRAVKSRSEEHTSELQSRLHIVCRLLLEKKKKLVSSAGATDLGLVNVPTSGRYLLVRVPTPFGFVIGSLTDARTCCPQQSASCTPNTPTF